MDIESHKHYDKRENRTYDEKMTCSKNIIES